MSNTGSEQTTGTSSASTSTPAKRQKTNNSSSSSSTAAAPIFSATRNINKVPVEVWKEHICFKFLTLKELSILRRCHTFFEKYWQNVMAQNVIRVPHGCPTVQKAMNLAVIFSERKEYTETEPLKIRLEEGVHEIVGSGYVNVTCSHITFVGKGKDHTTIRGGFRVTNQQHVKFEELTITHPYWQRVVIVRALV
jgi:pectate lyase